MKVNSVSFKGRLAKTKKGNVYEKTNTGKHIGTAVGAIGGALFAATPAFQLSTVTAAAKYTPKNVILGTTFIAGAALILNTLIFRGIGTIPDKIINHTRKVKADKTAETDKK